MNASTWQDRWDFIDRHIGKRAGWLVRGTDDHAEAHSCSMCGALVYERHLHAAWHLDGPQGEL